MRASLAVVRRHLRGRGRPIGFAALLVGLSGLFSAPPPEPTLDGVATMLGTAAGVQVSAADIRWEPRGGLVRELWRGRGVLFLGARAAGEPRDVFRAWVRLTPRGKPLAVTRVLPLTETPLGDERGLVSAHSHAAFASLSAGFVDAVTVLDGLGGSSALARSDVLVGAPVTRATLTLDERGLRIDLPELFRRAEYDFTRGVLRDDASGKLRVVTRRKPAEPGLAGWAERTRPLFGERLIALGGRLLYGMTDAAERVVRRAPSNAEQAAFRPLRRDWLAEPNGVDRSFGPPEAPFETAVLRPDPSRPQARLVLVAVDQRQLELGIVAGSTLPKAASGVNGDGQLPAGPLRKRLVAVFNGGPEAPYDRYGTKAGGRVLVPAEQGVPSVVVRRGQSVTLGAFPWLEPDVPEDVLAFAQRSTALVANGKLSSTGTGWDASVRRRSALCTTRGGQLYYAYADALDPETLARALVERGCTEALPLAAAPERLGFALIRARDDQELRFELVEPSMDFDPRPLVSAGATRDFFYLAARELLPDRPPGVLFRPDGGTQPPPAFLPGILRAEYAFGGLSVELFSIERGHVDFRLRAGSEEPGARGEPWAGALAAEEMARALAVLELGRTTNATRYGMALGTSVPLALRPSYATLVLAQDGPPRILLPREPVVLREREQAVQLPLLADDTVITARARERGDARVRAALCVAEAGRVLIASLRHDSSDPLAAVLRTAGCRRVVELDRGSRHPAFVHRAGTSSPPRADYATTTLWALSRALPATSAAAP